MAKRYYSDGIAIQRMGRDSWSCWADAGNAGPISLTVRSRFWVPIERLPGMIDSVIAEAESLGIDFRFWGSPTVLYSPDAQEGLPQLDVAAIADAESRRLGWAESYKEE